jgi:hypothetical protein
MPVTWQPVATTQLPSREWVRLPEVSFSELFRLEFSTPDWAEWKAKYAGYVLIRSVFTPSPGEEEISEDTRIWVDETAARRIIHLPFPPGYFVSGVTARCLELYRYPRRRYADNSLPLTAIVDRA